MRIEMKVSSLSFDPFTETPIVILRDGTGRHSVPLWIAHPEAASIAAELEGVRLDRPMTHDLLKAVLGVLGGKVAYVEIHDLRGGTFFATIHIVRPDGRDGAAAAGIDARPSDAIALALRTGAPIYVTKKVLDKVRRQADRHKLPTVVYEAPETPGGFVIDPAFKWKV
ncbi:MAG TPA: bifunctional nuclease family protein [Haliangiales bacterium]|nr:bifunctional nuclease family protein [Haliangiales bacterium]